VKPKDSIGYGVVLLVALLLISVGVVGIRDNPEPRDIVVALMFMAGGIYLFLRTGYRLIKKLELRSK
jgi:hypothetical protein